MTGYGAGIRRGEMAGDRFTQIANALFRSVMRVVLQRSFRSRRHPLRGHRLFSDAAGFGVSVIRPPLPGPQAPAAEGNAYRAAEALIAPIREAGDVRVGQCVENAVGAGGGQVVRRAGQFSEGVKSVSGSGLVDSVWLDGGAPYARGGDLADHSQDKRGRRGCGRAHPAGAAGRPARRSELVLQSVGHRIQVWVDGTGRIFASAG